MESSREAVWRRQNMKDGGNTTAGEFPGINKRYAILHWEHVRDNLSIFISLRVEWISTECKKVIYTNMAVSIEPGCAFRLLLLERMKSRKEELLKESEELGLQENPPSWKLERGESGETIGKMSLLEAEATVTAPGRNNWIAIFSCFWRLTEGWLKS